MTFYDAPAWNRRQVAAVRSRTPGLRLAQATAPTAAPAHGLRPLPCPADERPATAAPPRRSRPFPASPGGRQD